MGKTLSSLRTFTTNLVGVRTSFENVGLDAAADDKIKKVKKLRAVIQQCIMTLLNSIIQRF